MFSGFCCGHAEFVFSLRVPREFCFSDISLALKFHTFAVAPNGILFFGRFAAAQNSYFRCGSQAILTNLALGRQVKFAFSCFVHFLYRRTCFHGKSIRCGKSILQWVCNWSRLVGCSTKRTGPWGSPGALCRNLNAKLGSIDAKLHFTIKAVLYTPASFFFIQPTSRSHPPWGSYS